MRFDDFIINRCCRRSLASDSDANSDMRRRAELDASRFASSLPTRDTGLVPAVDSSSSSPLVFTFFNRFSSRFLPGVILSVLHRHSSVSLRHHVSLVQVDQLFILKKFCFFDVAYPAHVRAVRAPPENVVICHATDSAFSGIM
jgi:hypothetical protein